MNMAYYLFQLIFWVKKYVQPLNRAICGSEGE